MLPTILVIFGPTGDLMKKKLAPALWRLFLQGALPERLRIIGFGRRSFTTETFRAHVRELLNRQENGLEKLNAFLNVFDYRQGLLDNAADYQALNRTLTSVDKNWGICSSRLFYLAVPPELYETIFRRLAKSGLAKEALGCGWRRIAVEKPLGKDLKTSERLDALLGAFFPEKEIYRIDHYLAKEMLQNILAFRFSNNLFETNWSNETIERIDIKLWETLGVETRGAFYDPVGALRDVGQNHLLQMLALATMEQPGGFTPQAIRTRRAEILGALTAHSAAEIKTATFRAQYAGYEATPGVRPGSTTETYFKIRTFLDTPRWQGVPVTLESGKRLPAQEKEIVLTFKHPVPCLCPAGSQHSKNTARITLEPVEGITIHFWSKKPGPGFGLEERTLEFMLRPEQARTQYVEEYERLLLDCLHGDQTLFLSTEEVKAMWRFIDPIVRAWKRDVVSLKTYEPGSIPQSGSPEPATKAGTVPALRPPGVKKEIAMVGLGKMGANMARRLKQRGWQVAGFDRDEVLRESFRKEDFIVTPTLEALAEKLRAPRVVWLMVPHERVEAVLFGPAGLAAFLQKGDVIIDGGNSFYQDTIRRAKVLKWKNIELVDVGVSGGPAGALAGGSYMVGGRKKTFEKLEPLFYDLAAPQGCQFFEGVGAGHFVKMIHNGIEYGMMQAIAEGFSILKKSSYKLDLKRAADAYNRGSVIESRLMGQLQKAFALYGEDLRTVTGRAAHTGEGAWAVKTAKAMRLKVKIIEEALKFRIQSRKNPSYTGKILSALRAQFGGHSPFF